MNTKLAARLLVAARQLMAADWLPKVDSSPASPEAIKEALAHLGAAISQSGPQDDQMIQDHLYEAHDLLGGQHPNVIAALAHLNAAVRGSAPSDDQIIMEHMEAALKLLGGSKEASTRVAGEGDEAESLATAKQYLSELIDVTRRAQQELETKKTPRTCDDRVDGHDEPYSGRALG